MGFLGGGFATASLSTLSDAVLSPWVFHSRPFFLQLSFSVIYPLRATGLCAVCISRKSEIILPSWSVHLVSWISRQVSCMIVGKRGTMQDFMQLTVSSS